MTGSNDDAAADSGAWSSAPPADVVDVEQLARAARVPLPAEYLTFLRTSNGGEGELAVEPYWLVLWPAQDVLKSNQEYDVARYVPGFFAFGSSGGGEMFAFDTREGAPYPVVAIPFIPMDAREAVLVAPSFIELMQHLGAAGER